MDKAVRSLEVAEAIYKGGSFDFAASRAYYAYFYTVEALLLSQGISVSSHKEAISQYGLHFAKTKQLDPAFHKMMRRAFGLRQIGDYMVEKPVNPRDAEEVIREGWGFLEAARAYLASL